MVYYKEVNLHWEYVSKTYATYIILYVIKIYLNIILEEYLFLCISFSFIMH